MIKTHMFELRELRRFSQRGYVVLSLRCQKTAQTAF